MNSEPLRLFDDPSAAAGLRADLAVAAEGTVEGMNLAAGAAGLRSAIAAEAAVTATATASAGATAAASTGSGAMKVVLAIGLVAGGATAWWTSAPTSPTQATAVAVAPAVEAPAAKTAVAVEPPPAAPVVDAPVVAPPVLEEVEPTPAPQPEVVKPEPATPKKHPRAHKRAPSADVAPSKAEDHLKEARLVAEARRSLRSEPGQALKLLKEAQRDFPKGMLREEAEALSILALVELGRTTAATPRAKAFLARHSEGPYADAVRRAMATSDE